MLNVIYTLIGQPFRAWVDRLVDSRHEEIAEQKQLYIEMDPEIASIYNQSKAVSTSQGSSFNLMKASAKRRRSKKQIEEEKKQEALRQAEIEQKLADYDRMKSRLNEVKESDDYQKKGQVLMSDLWNSGLITQDGKGQICAVDDVEIAMQLKRQRQEQSDEAKRKEQEMAKNPYQGPHEERRRAGQQLEVNEEMLKESKKIVTKILVRYPDADQSVNKEDGSSLYQGDDQSHGHPSQDESKN